MIVTLTSLADTLAKAFSKRMTFDQISREFLSPQIFDNITYSDENKKVQILLKHKNPC